MSDTENTDDTGQKSGKDETNWQAKYEAALAHSRTWETRAQDNKAKADELDALKKNDRIVPEDGATAKDKEIADLKAQIAGKDRDILLTRISAKTGVEAKFLEGETEEAVQASADEFLSKYRPADAEGSDDDSDKDNDNVGYVPSQTGNNPDPASNSLKSSQERARAHAKKHKRG